MNYRHLYHAGSFADVVKHVVLIIVLQKFQEKPAGFQYLDTHAGIGLYPLQSVEAQKKQEYQNGVAKLLLKNDARAPACIQTYLSIVKQYNSGDALDFYPGSPLIARAMMREQDQMILCELHDNDFLALKKIESSCHHMDGYNALKAFLPPKLKRGVVLIDPPFEKKDEFETIVASIKKALMHWKSGCFIIWYPIKDKKQIQLFHKNLCALAPTYLIEFQLNAHDVQSTALRSIGIAILNPPWKIEADFAVALPYLARILNASSRASTTTY